MNKYGWRAYATCDGKSFINDEVTLYILHNSDKGKFPVREFILTMGDSVPDGASLPDGFEPPTISMDLAETLYYALAAVVFDVPDLPAEVERLRQALKVSEARVDKLINGIGRLGEQDGN